MRKELHIALQLATILLFAACEKVIDLDLREARPRVVIEGNITSGPGPYDVVISTSGGYFDSLGVKPVSGATVFLYYGPGYWEQLFELAPGVYRTDYTQGQEYESYELQVEYGGTVYSAEEFLPGGVEILELEVEKSIFSDFGPGNEEIYDVHCTFEDPADELNYYRFFIYVNGELRQSDFRPYDITDDELFNGLTYTYSFRRIEATSGDEIKVELQAVGPNTFQYFRTLNDALSRGIGSTPYNPISNISNGALGYFGAYAATTETIMVN